MKNKIYIGDVLKFLQQLPQSSVDLIYVFPPIHSHSPRLVSVTQEDLRDDNPFLVRLSSDRTLLIRDEFLEFLYPYLEQARRLLKQTGSFYIQVAPAQAHYLRPVLDNLFGRSCFLNEIIWVYKPTQKVSDRWPESHYTILVYVRQPGKQIFNLAEIDRLPYLAPSLVTQEKAKRGKLPTDVWWFTEFQNCNPHLPRPIELASRIIKAATTPNGVVLDFFAKEGVTGLAAYKHGRRFILAESNPQYARLLRSTFSSCKNCEIEWIEETAQV